MSFGCGLWTLGIAGGLGFALGGGLGLNWNGLGGFIGLNAGSDGVNIGGWIRPFFMRSFSKLLKN